MDDILNNPHVNVSVIDYIGQIGDGVGILVNIVAGDNIFELSYWFNRKGQFKIVPEQKILDKLGIDNIYEYDKLSELVYFIHNSIPKADLILDEFLN
jgi:hypothetical protein